MKSIDPARMSRAEILAELGDLLATGYRRRISSSMRRSEAANREQEELDVLTHSEAPCGEPREASA